MAVTQVGLLPEGSFGSLFDDAHWKEASKGGLVSTCSYRPQPPSWVGMFQALRHHLHTLFLFTKSDFKTVVFPQTAFAVAAACSPVKLTTADCPHSVVEVGLRLPRMLLWVWLHLLVENIANQRLPGSIVEDASNKPWRPLVSGRVSPQQAQTLLLAAIPVAVGVAALLDSFMPSVTLMTLIWMYNDLEGSGCGIWLRNALNAGGLMCFGWGALSTLSMGKLLPQCFTWLLLTGAVIMTTVHAQDFPDVQGDAARGRKTVPLLYGNVVARGSLAAMTMFWSVACPAFWSVELWAWIAPVGMGVLMAGLTLLNLGRGCDEVVWKMWCAWFAGIYLLPAFASP